MDTDSPAQLADTGEKLRDFLAPVCDSLIEKSLFTHACPLVGPGGRGLSLARKAKDCD